MGSSHELPPGKELIFAEREDHGINVKAIYHKETDTIDVRALDTRIGDVVLLAANADTWKEIFDHPYGEEANQERAREWAEERKYVASAASAEEIPSEWDTALDLLLAVPEEYRDIIALEARGVEDAAALSTFIHTRSEELANSRSPELAIPHSDEKVELVSQTDMEPSPSELRLVAGLEVELAERRDANAEVVLKVQKLGEKTLAIVEVIPLADGEDAFQVTGDGGKAMDLFEHPYGNREMREAA